MARRVIDKTLDSRDVRRKLKPRGKPYWRSIERGLHLGYRRLRDGAGPWIARRYLGQQRYDEQAIGVADDMSDADGVTVFDYWQAVDFARGSRSRATVSGPYAVADAVRAYIEFLTRERKTAYGVGVRMAAHVLPFLGEIAVAELTADTLRKWHAELAKQPPRVRTAPGRKQQYREITDDDGVRRRRVSANQCLAQLKAALNLAFNEGIVPSDHAWRKVKPFRGVIAARARYLTLAECSRLMNSCPPDFRNLVRGALETGARYSEITRMKVADFNPDVGTVAIHVSKTSKPRHVVLTADGEAFFKQICAGRTGTVFLRADGKPWGVSHQGRPMADACRHAKIEPSVGFHQLRHTWASLSVMNGVPLLVVAKNLGHSDTKMVEKFYGHLAPSFVVDAIRKHAPRFGVAAAKVKAIC